MRFLILSLLSALCISFLGDCKSSKSPEEKLMELAPRFQKAMCSKTIECTKDEIAKVPAQYRNMIPAFMQSEEACVAHFKESFEKSKKERQEKKQEVTPDMVTAFETCVDAVEKSNCDLYKGKGKHTIPGCEGLEKFSKN
ncbi:LA_2478/LA_2722/LA_4182 family protein [Leptospira inadai]